MRLHSSTVEEVVVTATPKEGYALGSGYMNRNDLVGICLYHRGSTRFSVTEPGR